MKDAFQHERNLSQEIERLKAQDYESRHTLQAQLAALRITNCSITAHLSQSQERLHEALMKRDDLEVQTGHLHARYSNMCQDYSRMQQDYNRLQQGKLEVEQQYAELSHINEANTAVISHQAVELQKLTDETQASHATTKELGQLVTTMVAPDFAGEAFEGVSNIAEVIQRNKYQNIQISKQGLQISKLQDELERLSNLSYCSAVSNGNTVSDNDIGRCLNMISMDPR